MHISLKVLSLIAAAGAVATMGIATVKPSHGSNGNAVVIVGTGSTQTPATTPTVPSAVPTVKATKFVGGDWNGI